MRLPTTDQDDHNNNNPGEDGTSIIISTKQRDDQDSTHQLVIVTSSDENENEEDHPLALQHHRHHTASTCVTEENNNNSTKDIEQQTKNDDKKPSGDNDDNNGHDDDELPTLEDLPLDFRTGFFSPFHFPENSSNNNNDSTSLSPSPHNFLSISKNLRSQAIAASITQVVGFVGIVIALAAVGRHSTVLELASCGIGISAFNVLAISIAVGWASAIDTLGSQAYGRLQKNAARIEEVGEITQRAMGSGLALCGLSGVSVFLFAKPLIRFVFGEVYVEGAAEFLHSAFPYLIAFVVVNVLYKSLQCEHRAKIPSHCSWVGLAVTTICSFILIPKFKIAGVCYTLFLSNFAQLCTCLYLAPADALFRQVPWFHFHGSGTTASEYYFSKIFTKDQLWEYTAVAVPTMLSVSAEWWAFEVLNVLIANMGNESSTAAFGVFFNVAVLCWCISSSGWSIACYSWVGKLLGEGKGMLALIFARTAVLWTWFTSLVVLLIVITFQSRIFGMYTSDPELKAELGNMLFLLFIYHQGDSIQYTAQAVFRGCGRQDETVKPVLMSLWVVGLPCAWGSLYFIAPTLKAMIGGFCCGFFFEIPILIWTILQWDWMELAEIASKEKEEEVVAIVGAGEQDEVDMKPV